MSMAFYNTKAWRKLSKVFLNSKNYICERCGGPACIAHHKTHLNPANVNDYAVSMNPALLEALCIDCHNAEHFKAGDITAAGLCFDGNGDLIKG